MILKPDFYDKFACIGGDCSFTCCQQWKIAVDDVTYQNWKMMNPPAFSKAAAKKDGFKKIARLSDYTRMKDGQRVVRLLKNGYCPFLTDKKLCQIVLDRGEECISHTCHIFPREMHEFENRTEYSLMPCCPEVVDFLERAEKFRIVLENSVDGAENEKASEAVNLKSESRKSEFVTLFEQRAWFVDFIQRTDISPELALKVIFFIALDNLEKCQFTDGEDGEEADNCEDELRLYKIPSEAEIEEIMQTIKQIPSSSTDSQTECNELFLDLIYNYRREGLYTDYLEEAEALAEKISAGEEELSGTLSDGKAEASFTSLIRKYLASELWSETLLPGFMAQDMVMKLEWIVMEFAAIRQLYRLKRQLHGELPYETVRDCIVVVSRMMGYDESDIVEYLENSFEDLIWEWGYFSLIAGEN